MTKAEALHVQAQQVEWYARLYPDIDVAGIVARATAADQLNDGEEHPMTEINKYIPRGGWIEMLIGKYRQMGD